MKAEWHDKKIATQPLLLEMCEGMFIRRICGSGCVWALQCPSV